MRQIRIEYKHFEDGRKGVTVSAKCPNGMECMVGSKECGKCKMFSPRKSNHEFVFCKAKGQKQ